MWDPKGLILPLTWVTAIIAHGFCDFKAFIAEIKWGVMVLFNQFTAHSCHQWIEELVDCLRLFSLWSHVCCIVMLWHVFWTHEPWQYSAYQLEYHMPHVSRYLYFCIKKGRVCLQQHNSFYNESCMSHVAKIYCLSVSQWVQWAVVGE